MTLGWQHSAGPGGHNDAMPGGVDVCGGVGSVSLLAPGEEVDLS